MPLENELITASNLLQSSGAYDVLLFWRDEFSRGYWEIGAIAYGQIALADQLKLKLNLSQEAIFVAIGTVVGKSGRTIRMYRDMHMYFSDNDRVQYGALTYAHFRKAREWGEQAFEFLDKSLELMDDKGGAVPSVTQVENAFAKEAGQVVSDLADFEGFPIADVQDDDLPDAYDDIPLGASVSTNAVVELLVAFLRRAMPLTNKLPPEMRSAVAEAFSQLENALGVSLGEGECVPA